MPGGDRTGPLGRGPMTGRALGYCAGYNDPGFSKGFPQGRGFGFGRGFGRGWGRGFGRGRGFWWRGSYPFSTPYYEPGPYYYPGTYSPVSQEDEKAYLEDLIKRLEEELKDVRDRIQELTKEKKENP